MNILIEKNVPLDNTRTVEKDFNFITTMEVGDSFLYPKKSRISIMKGIKKYSDRFDLNYEFTSRRINSDQENIRVWRIK